MNRYLIFLALLGAASAVAAAGAHAINSDVTATGADARSVNGSITVSAGTKSGELTTVNGSIRINADATASQAHSVNGDIRLGARAAVGSLHTVNGAITLGAEARVSDEINAVNGSISLQENSEVKGSLSNVNGTIKLVKAHVAGGIQTVGGDIDLADASHVEGGIWVRKPHSGFYEREPARPRIVIGPGSVVQGRLRFEHPVVLYVSDRTTIGPVTGATAISFSSEHPPG